MSNNPNQTRTWPSCLLQVFDLILLCPLQSLFSTRTPTRREYRSGLHSFKLSMALRSGLDIAKLLRMFSPPCRATGDAKAADLLNQSHHPSVLLLLGGNCYLPSVAPDGTLFKICWSSIVAGSMEGEGRVPLGQREDGGLFMGSCLDSRPSARVGILMVLVVGIQHKEENKCTPRRICLWEHLALRSRQRLLQEPSGRGGGEGGCGFQSTRESHAWGCL